MNVGNVQNSIYFDGDFSIKPIRQCYSNKESLGDGDLEKRYCFVCCVGHIMREQRAAMMVMLEIKTLPLLIFRKDRTKWTV